MSFDYFYGQQSDLFTFYRVPKVLFTNEKFWNISADAKMLYGILLDRMSLPAKNGWIDSSYSKKSRKRRKHRKRQSLIRMLIMWTMTRIMDTIRSLRTMMQIASSMKMIMNLCKQDRLDAWADFGLPLHSIHFQKIKYFVFLKANS